MILNMAEAIPAKRRRTETPQENGCSGKVAREKSKNAIEITQVSVKADKFQKLRRIAANCKEKIQISKSDDVVISSVGSSPSSSPRSNNLAVLSNPVDPFELHARLKILVKDEKPLKFADAAENSSLDTGKTIHDETGCVKTAESAGSVVLKDRNMKDENEHSLPKLNEEFYAMLRKLVNEKLEKLEKTYNEKIIPNLEEKIAYLESENKCLSDQVNKLQEMLNKMKTEKMPEKIDCADAAVQVTLRSPPSLTPVPVSASTVEARQPVEVLLIDSASTNKQPMTTVLQSFTSIMTTPLSRVQTVMGNTANYMLTTSVCQPRLYSDAPYKSVNVQRPVVSPLPSNHVRATGPITATVYPQPQHLQASPSTLAANRGSQPLQTSPSRIPYHPQVPMVRTQAQTPSRYMVSKIREDGVRRMQPNEGQASIRGPRATIPNVPPPSYSMARARLRQQVTYRSGNPAQASGVRHYTLQKNVPASGGIATTPGAPPPLVRAQPNGYTHAPSNTQQRFVMQRSPYQQNRPPGVDPRARMPRAPGGSPRHPPAPPLPPPGSPVGGHAGLPPPTPNVSICGAANGIVLSWDMSIPEGCAPIDSYQLFAHQNSQINQANSPWKKLGIVKALPLPMACTLTQFVSGSMYYFAVRAMDIHGRAGDYSTPCGITLPSENEKGLT